MMRSLVVAGLLALPVACSSSSGSGGTTDGGTGGATSAEGGSSGGGATGAGGEASSGGASIGGSGGRASAGGRAGSSNGGSSAGAASSGGASNGGASNGGASNGGASNGGASNGGASNGGANAGNGGAAGDTADAGGSTTGQWVLGYYVGYQINDYPIADIDWTALTHIAFAPLIVNGDRSLDLGFNDSNGKGEDDAKALAVAAHAHGVKALLMLGGAGAGANIAAAAAPVHLAEFVTTLTSGLTTLGYDGIDLDWEDSVNMDDLVALAAALRAAKPNIVLSYPAGAINSNYQSADTQSAALAKSLDRFNVQTYYPSTAFAGSGWSSWFSSPLSGISGATPVAIDDTLQRYAAAGVPKEKLGMGIEFSAICYTGGITAPRQPTDGSSQRIVGGDNAYPLTAFFVSGSTFDESKPSERKIDSVAQEPFLSLGTAVNDSKCGASTQYLTYEDETSIIAKGTFSKSKGYGGIIIWTIQQGYLPAQASGGRSRNALMQALKTGFLD